MDRRDFIRSVGAALASLLAARCYPAATCYTPAMPTPTGEGAWGRLRQPWTDLDRLARDASDPERGEATRARLVAGHRAALDELVQTGELDPAVADEMQLAFEGAAYHTWRANAPLTCYLPAPWPDYVTESNVDLARQAEALEAMAAQSDLDPATVAQARASIERDIAFLTMPDAEQQALVAAIVQAAGNSTDYPSLAELDLDIPPESLEAARILVELLLGQR